MLIDFLLANGLNLVAGVLKSYLMAVSGSFTMVVVFTVRKMISTLITITMFNEPLPTIGLIGVFLTLSGSLLEFLPELLSKPKQDTVVPTKKDS